METIFPEEDLVLDGELAEEEEAKAWVFATVTGADFKTRERLKTRYAALNY